jgi:hypothetical protein
MDTEGNQTSRDLSYLKSMICAEFKHAFIGTTAAILTIIQMIWIIYTGLSGHLQFEEAPPLAKGQIVPNSNFVALAILICALFQVAVSFLWFKVRSWTSGLPVSWKLTTDVAYSLIAAWLTVINSSKLTKYLVVHQCEYYYVTFQFVSFLLSVFSILLIFLLNRESKKGSNRIFIDHVLVPSLIYIALVYVLYGYSQSALNVIQNQMIDLSNKGLRSCY